MTKFSDFTISECDAVVEKYGLEDFDSFLQNRFPRYSESERFAVLSQWDAMLAEETQLTREHAEHFARKRLLDTVHFALKKAGK